MAAHVDDVLSQALLLSEDQRRELITRLLQEQGLARASARFWAPRSLEQLCREQGLEHSPTLAQLRDPILWPEDDDLEDFLAERLQKFLVLYPPMSPSAATELRFSMIARAQDGPFRCEMLGPPSLSSINSLFAHSTKDFEAIELLKPSNHQGQRRPQARVKAAAQPSAATDLSLGRRRRMSPCHGFLPFSCLTVVAQP